MGKKILWRVVKKVEKNKHDGKECTKPTIYEVFDLYIGGGNVQINRYLRCGETELFDTEHKVYADIISAEIDKFYIPENIVTYRVIDKYGLCKMTKGRVKKGTILMDRALLSTGLVYDNLRNKPNKDYLLQILVPKGTKGIYIGLISGLNEQELILSSNTKMKVIDIYKYDKKKVFQCILIRD